MYDCCDDAEDFPVSIFRDFEWRVGGVFRQEPGSGGEGESFDGELAPERGDNDVALVGFQRAVNDEYVSFEDACPCHGVSSGADKKRSRGAFNAELV